MVLISSCEKEDPIKNRNEANVNKKYFNGFNFACIVFFDDVNLCPTVVKFDFKTETTAQFTVYSSNEKILIPSFRV